MPFLRLRHTFDLLRGRYDNPGDPGEIPHFQALSSALSGTIGMGNIAGVAIAISMGGPGAIFWMWMAGLLGMCTKFFTCTLACMYRQKDEDGIAQGGPMYFIEVGLGPRFKPLALMFAVCGMMGCLPLFQANQFAGLLQAEWDVDRTLTGLVAMVFVGSVILGGIRRVGAVTSRLVPLMFIVYFFSSMLVIISHYEIIPALFTEIFGAAFGGQALLGGAVGLTFKEVLVTGVKRAVFSNAGGARNRGPGPWRSADRGTGPGRPGRHDRPFYRYDYCLYSDCPGDTQRRYPPSGNGVVMTADAFEQTMPFLGSVVLLITFSLFAVSTMISYSYYSVKCARYLLGKRIGGRYVYIYLLLIPVAASWNQATAVNIIDTAFALMVIPTLTATTLLAPKVAEEMRRYFKELE